MPGRRANNYKIALRMVPFITDQRPWEVIGLLAAPLEIDGHYIGIYNAYEWRGNTEHHARVNSTLFRDIKNRLRDDEALHSYSKVLSRIPQHFFMWSNDLEESYWLLQELTRTYEECSDSDGLNWNPSVYPYDDIIAECPDALRSSSSQTQLYVSSSTRKTRLREAMEAGYANYVESHGTEPSANHLLRYLAREDATDTIVGLTADGLEWRKANGEVKEIAFKTFANQLVRVRTQFRQQNPT